jgi:hypothetical protein
MAERDTKAALQLAILEVFGDAELWVSAKSYTDVLSPMQNSILDNKGCTAGEDSL